MSRLADASRRPSSRSACRMATPTTSPGIIRGDTMNVTSAVLPGNDPRVTPMAHSVPRASDTAVEARAIANDSRTAGQRSRNRSVRSYQRVESAGGGRLNTGDALTETASVTINGASRASTTAARAASACGLPATGDYRARRDHGDRDEQQHHGDRRAHGAVAHEQERAR